VFFQKIPVAIAGLGREKLKGNDRLPRRPFCRVNVANKLHLDGGLLAEAGAKPSFVVWSARTCPRFVPTRRVASGESGDTSPQSKGKEIAAQQNKKPLPAGPEGACGSN
jgi:hypothetical protein